ncbi:MAG TPA: PAS domain-containing sensor histidine kinase, partial [Chloroflexota bacterium]|nr:PAS domain-containing sensor histidine kinase [Chloroflexota bacterium]
DTLQQRDRLYRLLVENSLGLMCSHDLDGVLLSINPAAAHSLGYQAQDGIGRNLREFLAPAIRPLFDAYLARIRRQPSDTGLLRLVARDGSERVWMYHNVRYEEPGAAPLVLGHAVDLTERLQAEQALKESEERFRVMVNTVPVLIWMAAPDGARTFFNAPWLEFTGRSLGQEAGSGWMDAIQPDDAPRCRHLYRRAVQARADFRIEYRLRRADGTFRWVRDMGVPRFAPDGTFAGFIGSCIDITADRQAVEEREARSQAEAALRLRDDVLALATHDLRAPLTSIMGRIDLVTQHLQRGGVADTTYLARQMQALRTATLHMLAVTDEIDDVARLQMGQHLDLRVEEIDLGELARAVAEEYGVAAGTAQVTVGVPAGRVAAHGDRARLTRVVRNLVDNGIKYSPQRSPVRIIVRQDGPWAVIAVSDHGVGIPADELPHVFTRFFRAATAAGVKGSGLGLAGARAIAEQHGGEIAIASVVEHGTTVTLRLPAAVG